MKLRGNIELKFDKKDWLYFISLIIMVALIFNGDIGTAIAFMVKLFSK